MCARDLSTYRMSQKKRSYIHVSFVIQEASGVNEHMCMLSHLDHMYMYAYTEYSEIRGMSFFLAAIYLRHSAYCIAHYFIFLFVFLLVSLKCISVWNNLAIMFTI